MASVTGLAIDLQTILGKARDTTRAMFPHKLAPAPTRSTLPCHLWPKSPRHDISNMRRPTTSIPRLIKLEAISLADTQEESSHLDAPLSLWSSVNTPLPRRTVLSLPPSDLDTLGLLTREDLEPDRVAPPLQALQFLFEA